MAIWGDRNWRSGLLGAFSIIGVLAHVIFCSENHALAQISPDGTLGDNSSKITPNVNIKGSVADRIDGGATRGANLFHSFQDFNVGELQRVYFANPTGIENILTRVTGSNVSNILGTLGVDGGANLFFLNPNGILFGNNARLDVGGSFVASTANSFVFGNGLEFSATNPRTPSPLLTVNPSALLFNQIGAAPIQNDSQASAGLDQSGFDAFGLRVPDGHSLLLVGGNISMDGGSLNAYGGRVELGGLATPGIVGLLLDGDNLSLRFPADSTRADVSLTNQASIFVEGAGGGSIAVNARNIDILERSLLSAGIGQGLGTPDTVAGDIALDATGEIVVGSRTGLINVVESQAVGKGGNINITTGSLLVRNDGVLYASTKGKGDAGNVNIYAKTVSLGGVGGGVGGIASQVFREGEGNGGDINITARSLSLTNGGQISAATFGTGDAGSVNINARDTVSLNRGYIFSSTDEGSVGNGNSVNITSGSISLTDGAELVVQTRGQGDAGSVNINVRDIASFDGEDSEGNSSGVFSSVVSGAVGQAGYIGITARSLSLTNGAQLVAATFGTGDAGSVNINARDTVSLDGVSSSGSSSAIFSSVQRGGVGNGRSINIKTESLSVTNGATVSASTRGSGDGGNITVNANTLEALNGGQIITNSLSIGKAGNITLNVIDSVTLAGSDQTYTARLAQFGGIVGNVGADSGLFASTNPEATGNGGNISVNSRKLTVQDSAKIAVNSQGTGVGGNIEIQTDNLTLNNQGLISAETVSNQGGGIEIGLKDILLLRQGSRISTNAGTAQAGGDGGNITINAPNGFLIAVPNENSNITANAFKGSGGKVQINAAGIFGLIVLSREDLVRLLGTNDLTQLDLQQLPSSITAISQTSPTLNGQVTINTPDTDPARGLIQLPSNLVDASQQIASGCTPGGRQTASRFIATGRGGLPLSPNEPLRGRAVMTGWVDLPPQATERVTDKLSVEITDKKTTASVTKPTNQIVEAQGWIVDGNGDVILVAQSPQSSSIPSAMSCSQ